MASEPIDEKAVFNIARRIDSREARADYLQQVSGADPDALQRVVELLQVHEQQQSFLESPAFAVRGTIDQPPLERPGTQIGPYKLLQQIGEGGMGVVYMAEQYEPVKRRVALKIIKPGMDSRQVIARFEAERQALSLMDHPNIAKVLDAGTTGQKDEQDLKGPSASSFIPHPSSFSSGRPYFVMELVKGQPITQYCDEHHLTPRQRLELLLPVCQAIQHAHQKGIIHRDIKPTNILVAEYDQRPVPKVIDFGVAKATSQALTEKTMFTGFGQIVGTLEYMSPEQAKVNQLDIDTRSDIYSLGVLLYELLTGSTPFDKQRLRSAAFDEMLRIIREEEPPKPSTRLSDANASLPSISAQRHTEPAKLTKLVRGELDWIVMKALEKDRNRRYETVNGFAMDMQRYLADEAVQACPPSAEYRLRKFARRNKAALTMASILAGALVVAVVALSVSNLLVARERDQKTQALSDKVQALANESAALAKAKEHEVLANERAEEANKQQTIATEQELIARRRFYAAQTNLAQQAWEAGQPARTLELLQSQRPKLDQEDLRGFDWYYLWRLCHHNHHRTLTGPQRQAVYSLAITPDGTTLVSGSTDACVHVWNVATGNERAVLSGHKNSIVRLAISPDGKMVASASWDTTVKLWDLGTSKLLATLAGRSEMVRSVAFSPDGGVLAVGTEDGALELWDVGARTRRLTLRAHPAPVIALAYSPDGKMLATGAGWGTNHGPGSVKVWDVTSESPQIVLQSTPAECVAFSPDSKLLATTNFGVKVWSVPAGELKESLESPDNRIETIAFSPDGNTLVFGCHDRTVKLWDRTTGATRTVGVHLAAVTAVAFSPQGDLIVSGSNDGTVKLWHSAPLPDALSFAHKSTIRALAFTLDRKDLVVGSDDPTTLLDATTGTEATTLPVSGVLAVSADTNLLAARAPDDKRVIWDVAAARARAVLPVGPGFSGAAFSRDGQTLVTWTQDLDASDVELRFWDLETSRVRLTIRPRELSLGDILCTAISPDGKTLATGRQFGNVTLWDLTTGLEQMTLQRNEKSLQSANAVAFSNDGKLLAAGNSAGILRLWDVETGQLKVSFKGHTAAIQSVAFSPDDKTLLSGSADRTARLWDVVTGQEVLTLKGHKFAVHLVAFAADGKRIATASSNEVKLWLAAAEQEATAFQLELDPDDADSPRATNNWGDRLLAAHRSFEAEDAYIKALGRLEKLTAALPDIVDYRQELAYSLLVTAVSRSSTDQTQSVEHAHRRATEVYQQLTLDQQRTLAIRYDSLARRMNADRDPTPENSIRAVELAKKAVELCATDVRIWYTLGIANYRAGQWQSAIDALNKSLGERAAGEFRNWFYLSMAYWKVGAKDEARKWYRAALAWMEKRSPRAEELVRLRSEAAALLGLAENVGDAIEQTVTDDLDLWALYLDADPKADWAYRARGQIHLARGNFDQAILDFAKVTDLTPLDPQAWFDRGDAHYRFQEYPQAAAALEKFEGMSPGVIHHHRFFLAMAYWQMGEKEKASQAFAQAVQWMDKEQPTNQEQLRFRAKAAALLGINDHIEKLKSPESK